MTAASTADRAARTPVATWQLVGGFLIIYVVWGSTYLAIKWAVATIPPFALGAMRFLLAGSALYAWSRWRGAPAPTAANWRASAIVGALLLFIGNGAVSWASRRVTSGIASVLVATVPLWLVLSEAWQGKRPSVAQLAGVVVGLLGVGLLVLPSHGASAAADGSPPAIDPIGATVLVLGSLSWTLGSLYSRTAPQSTSASQAIAMQMLTGGALLATLALITGDWSRLATSHVSTVSILSLAYLITFGSLIGFSTYMWLLTVASPTAVGTYAYVNPLVAVLLGVWLGGERLPSSALLAMAVIVGGVAMVNLVGRKPATLDPNPKPKD